MFGYVDTGLNIVDVEDLAAGHLLAEISGRPPVRLRIPHSVALAWSYVDGGLARLNPHHTPAATPDKVRLSRRYEFCDPSKAVRELGLPQTPVEEGLHTAVERYRDHGYAPKPD
jgi:dihydroflavonol-4-reductase